MNIDLARDVVRVAFRSSSELAELVPFLKSYLSAEEYSTYAKAIGLAVVSIQVDLMNKLVADHPGLEADIEASIAKYGRYL
jgi:hypothetical protein